MIKVETSNNNNNNNNKTKLALNLFCNRSFFHIKSSIFFIGKNRYDAIDFTQPIHNHLFFSWFVE